MKNFKYFFNEAIKRDKMTAVDPYYGKSSARGGKSGGPPVFGVDHKKTTVWFTKRKDAVAFEKWRKTANWDGNADLAFSMSKDGIRLTGKIPSGH